VTACDDMLDAPRRPGPRGGVEIGRIWYSFIVASVPAPSVVTLTLQGQLTRDALALELRRAEAELREDSSMIVDCVAMEDYEPEARVLFVNWHRKHRLQRVAVITENRLWHMLVSAMSLASGQRMRAFSEVPAAREWLIGQSPSRSSRPAK